MPQFNRISFRRLTVLPALALVAVLFMAPQLAVAEEPPPLTYGADLVTSYVSRGKDLFTSAYDKEGKAHATLPMTPALQPAITLNGPGGFAFGLWGSFALTNRAPEADKNFSGLETLDELDYTLSWSWSNSLGDYSTGLALYTTTGVATQSASNELFISFAPKALSSMGGTLTHYVVPDAKSGGGTYTQFAISGGEAVTWGLSVGQGVKLQDVTAKVGYAMGDLSVAFNAAYRPNPEMVGYAESGKYTVGATTEDYPPAIFWLSVSYIGSVAP